MKRLVDLAMGAMAFVLAWFGAAQGASAATVTPADDSYVSLDAQNTSYGSGTELVVKTKRNVSTNASYASQEAVIQFKMNATDHATDAAIYLDVSTYDEAVTSSFYVWGISDSASVEDVNESSVTWSTLSGIVSNNAVGMNQSSASLYDGDASTSTKDALGTFTLTQADLSHTVKFTSDALVDFINADTDGVITVVISRALRSNSFDSAFASSEHATLSGPRLFVAASETVYAADDTHVRYGTSEVNGSSTSIFVKNAGNTSTNTRKGVIEFDITTGTKVESATMFLDVSSYNSTGALPSNTFFWVWGVKDGASNEDLNEATAATSTYSDVFNASNDGVANEAVTKLGTFRVYSTDLGGTVAFSSSALTDFINADTNGKVTLLITRNSSDSSFNTQFASSEHSSLTGPRLTITESLDSVTSSTMDLRYEDVDNDGANDLILVVSNHGGGGYIVVDPFEIAEILYVSGYNFGSDVDFWSTLSATQQASLLATVTSLVGSVGTTVSATELETAIAGLPEGREYEVLIFTGDMSTAVDDVSVDMSALSTTTAQSAAGYVTVELGTVNGAMTVTKDSFAFGCEANLFVYTAGVGNADGTTVALSLSGGAGLMAELSYGKNDQYGFTVPLVVLPIGVSVYVKGSDAVAVYNTVRAWVTVWGGDMVDWSQYLWTNAIDFTNDVYAVMIDSVNEAFVYVENSYGVAEVWVSEAGKETITWLTGTSATVASEVSTAVENAMSDVADVSANAATDLASWSVGAATTVVSTYDSVSGWVSGAASTAANTVDDALDTTADAIDDGLDWVCKYACFW